MTEREKIANENLQKIANFINENLPEGMGFVVLAFEFGMNADENRLMYVSNANRDDVVDAMDEFKEKVGKKQFGKHDSAMKKTWYDANELLELNLDSSATIWCLNKLNYQDFVTTMGDLKGSIDAFGVDKLRHFQFTIIEEDKDVK